jgi:hypothetical protein
MGRARHRARSDHCVQGDGWRDGPYTPRLPVSGAAAVLGSGRDAKASNFVCLDDSDRDDNQPPAPKYLNDGDNYPIVPIEDRDRDHGHDHGNR